MVIDVSAIRPAAIRPRPGLDGETKIRIVTLEPIAIGRYINNMPRFPVGASGRTGGSCRESSPLGISGGDCRGGRRNSVVLTTTGPFRGRRGGSPFS
jgi:hypothetical protein